MKKGFSCNALRFVGATSALIPVGMPATILAQTVDGAAVRRADEIIVTARRREESLQDIPVSVSALTGDRIAELQADDLSGIQYSVPNFYFDEGDASNAVVYLRGIGQNDSLAFADAGVGVYVDDVFIARSQAAFLELFDVERVEVLRGPQGTLYGRNTIGGAVKFISKEPTDEVEAYAEFGAGNFGMITAKGRLSGPVSDRIRMKAAVAYTKRDGFNENQFDGLDNGDQDSLSGRIGIYFDARDDLDFALTVDARRERPDTARSPALVTPARGFPDPVGQPFFVQTFQPNADPFVVNTNASNRSDTDALGITLRGTWQMNDQWSFESITSYRTFDFDLQLDTDGTPLPLLDVAVIQEQSQFSQELRASYEGDNGLSATGGLYYFHDDDLTFSGVDNLGAVLSFPAVPGGPILDFSVPLLGLASSALADTDQVTDSYAVFADVTWDFAPRWSVSAGLRYTLEEKSSARRFEQFFDPTLFVVPNPPEFLVGNGVPGVVIENEDDFDAFTPRFSLSYAPTDDILLYASASRGFKSGGFDGRANSDAQFVPFDPEFVWAYEAGAKTSFADGRVVVNAAYFYNDYTDLQVTSFAADPDTGVFVSQFTNAAAATIQGFEMEVSAQATEELQFTAALGLMDASYDEFDILVGGVVTDVSDRPLVNTPDITASLGATYTKKISSNLVLTLHADSNYRDEVATEISATPELTQESYWLSNAFLSLSGAEGKWEARVGVRNIEDEAIQVQGFNLSEFPGLQTAFFRAPRTYDFRLIFNY